MASIHHEMTVEIGVERAWTALRAVGAAHELFAPVLVDAELSGDIRTVRFANGMVVREQILDVDETRRRVAYAVLDGPGMRYHHASMQVFDAGPERCRFVWITDFLPEELRGTLEPLIQAGSKALKEHLEAVNA
jgi:Polyketide cyclase / dehydrase and lipid transport